MLPSDSTNRLSHPLALALIERMRPSQGASILEVGTGSGRNADVLMQAGFAVYSTIDYSDLPPVKVLFDAALSTHALLHGTIREIDTAQRAIAARLVTGAPLYATFGSTADARFENGTRIDAFTFAPVDGDERAVAHTFFDRHRLCALLENRYEIDSMEERNVDEIAGVWAHAARPLKASTHWFVIAAKRAP